MTQGLARKSKTHLAKYDPDKGLKKIALLEGVEKHWARAKDAEKLKPVIRAKLEAQAEFVYWWDTQVEKQQGARGVGKKVASQIGNATRIAGKDGLPDRATISRWRTKLNASPQAFETAYEAAVSRYIKILEFETAGAHVGQNTGEQEWYTPAEFIEAARQVLGDIDLDPASSDAANRIVKAAQIFTAKDDGLNQRWDGRVWMNPPYSQPLVTQFCEKLAVSVNDGTVTAAVVLVNNATETQWFRALADVASAMCFPTGRVRFWAPGKESATPLQGQAVLYTGPEIASFQHNFRRFGFVVSVLP